MISLQRSIGIECYYFIDYVSNNKEISENTHLIECLQQLSCKSDPKQSSFALSLSELCCAIHSGKKELMRELLCRYKEWDRTVLDFIYDNRSLLEKKRLFNTVRISYFCSYTINRGRFQRIQLHLSYKNIIVSKCNRYLRNYNNVFNEI